MPTNKKLGRVLLLDAISPRTVAIARSLGKRQIQVTCADETFFNLAFYSRYCDHRFTYPSPERQPKAFVERLLNFLEENPQDCIISVKEETLDVLLAERQVFSQLTRLPYPDNVIFQICRDKFKTMSLAASTGIPHPRTFLAANFDQVQELADSVQYPVVIKPRLSYSGIGIRYAKNEAELLEAYRDVHSQYPFPMVQEEIPAGEKFDVACLMDENARPVATFAQREIRSFPVRDGASTVQESVWRPDLIELTVQLLQKIGWTGIAEAEFMIDPRDGTPKLLEINPRFWGSVQLAIQSDVDFPYLLYQLARGEQVTPVHTYKVGQLCRQLLPYDILHFISNRQRFQMQPSFFDFSNPQVGYTLLSRDDPGPAFGFALSCGRYLFDPAKWKNLARMEKFSERIARLLGSQPAVGQQSDEPSAHMGQTLLKQER